MASHPRQQYFGHFSTSSSYPQAAPSDDDHPKQSKLTSAGYMDEDEDDNDDIVGSYLSDSQTFLKAWSSINNPFNPHNPSASTSSTHDPSQSWTQPPYGSSKSSSQSSQSTAQQSSGVLAPGSVAAGPAPVHMASPYSHSPAPSHATGQGTSTGSSNPQKSVRKSSSSRKLKPSTSISNINASLTTTGTGINTSGTTAASLPDPSLFPDPYPSGYGTSNNASTTPPVSLFSAGSSSARSSAYASASPGSALRSSVASSDSAHNNARHHPHPSSSHILTSPARLSTGDALITNLPHFNHSYFDSTDPIHPLGLSHADMPHSHLSGTAATTTSLSADEMAQLRDMDQLPSAVTARPGFHSAPGSRPGTMGEDPTHGSGQTRWSSSSAASEASKSSSWGNFNSMDQGNRHSGAGSGGGGAGNRSDPVGYEWNHHHHHEAGDEARDDEDFVSDEEGELPEDDMERTAAILLAEQGHGEIVHGEGKDVGELHVPMNTTHLLLGASASPYHVPGFLTNTLPSISQTLLALDISSNFLNALPYPLTACRNLEELNIGSNPLRALPTWMAVLTNLRVLIADSIGINNIPTSLSGLVRLHTLGIRNNRMHSLPSWLCLLPALEALYIEGNPFQGPWKALVEPLVPRIQPLTPSLRSPQYPPNTPRTIDSVDSTEPSEWGEERHEEVEYRAPAPAPTPWTRGHRKGSSKDFNESISMERPATATTGRARALTLDRERSESISIAAGAPRAKTMFQQDAQSPRPHTTFASPDSPGLKPLARTRTTPTRRPSAASQMPPGEGSGRDTPSSLLSVGRHNSEAALHSNDIHGLQGDRQLGRESPADRVSSPSTLRKMKSAGDVKHAGLERSASAIDPLPNEMGEMDYDSGLGKFMSVGARGTMKEEYRALTATMFETPSPSITSPATVRGNNFNSKDKGEKNKWGFLKKMSKSRLRANTSYHDEDGHAASAASSTQSLGAPRHMGGMGGPSDSVPLMPGSSSGNATPGAPFATASQVGFRSSGNLGQTSPQRRVLSKRTADSTHNTMSTASSTGFSGFSGITSSSTTSLSRTINSPPGQTSQPPTPGFLAPPSHSPGPGGTPRRAKRRSFLPVDGPSPITIPTTRNSGNFVVVDGTPGSNAQAHSAPVSPGYLSIPSSPMIDDEEKERERHQRALRSVMGYLRDMCDLSAGTSTGAVAVTAAATAAQAQVNANPNYGMQGNRSTSTSNPASRNPSRPPSRRPTLSSADAARTLSDFAGSSVAMPSSSNNMPGTGLNTSSDRAKDSSNTNDPDGPLSVDPLQPPVEEKKVKDDKGKRAMVVREIVSTERTYVKLLEELVDIYVKPAALPVTGIANVSSKETVVPAGERKIVFNGLDSLLIFHKDSFLKSLEGAAKILDTADDVDGSISTQAAIKVAQVFVSHAAFMRMYSTYINNFDNALRRTKQWTDKNLASAVVGTSAAGATVAGSAANMEGNSNMNLTPSQRKRIKQYLKRCRANPRHSQMNMESYLLLPVQRIPRYRLLFEELVRATPAGSDPADGALQKALDEITVLASNMNEGKREAETRRKLVQWQSRIRGKFPSPLVQPHRRLIMDGLLHLTRVVRKTASYFEVPNPNGEKTLVSVECLSPELTPRSLIAILCNDLLVLCKDPTGGKDPTSNVDLWAVLRMQTVSQPASIVHGNALRLVDNKAILYFDLPSTAEALTWSRAINMHIPASTK